MTQRVKLPEKKKVSANAHVSLIPFYSLGTSSPNLNSKAFITVFNRRLRCSHWFWVSLCTSRLTSFRQFTAVIPVLTALRPLFIEAFNYLKRPIILLLGWAAMEGDLIAFWQIVKGGYGGLMRFSCSSFSLSFFLFRLRGEGGLWEVKRRLGSGRCEDIRIRRRQNRKMKLTASENKKMVIRLSSFIKATLSKY